MAGREIFQPDVIAADGLDEGGMAQRAFGGRTAAECRIPHDFAGSDDADMVGIDGVDQAGAARYPFSLPADLGDWIVFEIRCSYDGGIFFQTEKRIRAKREGAAEIIACGKYDFAAAE